MTWTKEDTRRIRAERKALGLCYCGRSRDSNYELCKDCRNSVNKSHIYSRYGLTKKAYQNLLHDQDYKCAICLIDLDSTSLTTIPHVDHNHRTNQTRGLLCRSCNLLIGHSKESIINLTNAIEYLERGL